MSYASQPASNSKNALVLITLAVCGLSVVELCLLVGGYLAFSGRLESRQSRQLRQLQADLALVQEAERLNRRQMVPNQPISSLPSIPSIPHTSSGPAPGTPYGSIGSVFPQDKVHILWRGTWYRGVVLETRGMQAKVHYDDYSNAYDEWVTVDRLRRVPMVMTGGQKNPSTPAVPKPKEPSENLNAPFNSRFPAQDTVTRSWRDRSGAVVFHGRLYANYGSAIRLISGFPGGGSYQSIPYALKNLSDEDQAYVKRFPEISPDTVMSPRIEEPRTITPPAPAPVPAQPATPPVVETPQLPLPPPAADPLKTQRTWSDSTGQFQLEATFLSVASGQVQLQRPDGKVVTMPLSKLAAADRALIRAKYPNE